VPLLADKGEYIASESTFYRILKSEKQLQHRLKSKPVKSVNKPQALKATAPNQIYSWDITYLPTQVLGLFFICIWSWIFTVERLLDGKFKKWNRVY
jgi:hypothetical protein